MKLFSTAKAKTEMEPAKPGPREELAEAIRVFARVEADIAATEKTLAAAEDARWEAQKRLKEIEDADSQSAGQQSIEDRKEEVTDIVRRATAGGAVDVDILQSHFRPAGISTEELKHSLEGWKKAEDACRETLGHLKDEADWRKADVHDRARTVFLFESEPIIDRLLDGLDAIYAEVVSRRAALLWLRSAHAVPQSRKEQVDAALIGGIPPFYLQGENWNDNPDARVLRDALQALYTDATAPLPYNDGSAK
jgi:hypothetical protein